jgi:hypothetical protein
MARLKKIEINTTINLKPIEDRGDNIFLFTTILF